ncbi:hypothetical protein CRE_14283 [Caenorhabditis remanei]|uniref:Uncharacterized protein n=1 Tax=Caenorhabditis remanei TaxID=31234 RepID=E3NBU9_CAERE|nr:hypothetical protein CRE_14283 [Caenorhabditis remanei]
MENEQQQAQTAPSCRAGCGFFGASATEGYCSQCFKNTLKRQQDAVRLTSPGFSCRCGGLYCGDHRYDQAHNCQFDYKTMERETIRKNNPVVVSDKVQRI